MRMIPVSMSKHITTQLRIKIKMMFQKFLQPEGIIKSFSAYLLCTRQNNSMR